MLFLSLSCYFAPLEELTYILAVLLRNWYWDYLYKLTLKLRSSLLFLPNCRRILLPIYGRQFSSYILHSSLSQRLISL